MSLDNSVHLCEEHADLLQRTLRSVGLGDYMIGDGQARELHAEDIAQMCFDREKFNALIFAQGRIFAFLSQLTFGMFGAPHALMMPYFDWPRCPICRTLLFQSEHERFCSDEECALGNWEVEPWLRVVADETRGHLNQLNRPRKRKAAKK